jgi:hypothetical protein
MLYGRYPTGGWGWSWVGDPDRGANGLPTGASSPSQTGGWIYNILPFTEYQNIHDMGKGQPAAAKQAAIGQRVGITIKMFNCPTRPRQGNPYQGGYHGYGETPNAPLLARADYAANVGDSTFDEIFNGPSSEAQGDSPTYSWPDTSGLTGITYQRSWIRPSDITKGLSDVYLYGEKYLDPDNYNNGQDAADNENMYCGMDNDVTRATYYPPMRDTSGVSNPELFGSNHLLGFYMAYCDGSVRFIPYNVNPAIHKAAGNRFAN